MSMKKLGVSMKNRFWKNKSRIS